MEGSVGIAKIAEDLTLGRIKPTNKTDISPGLNYG